jgi:hypothetical protein
VYDPASITAYWGKRPRSVATRIVQLLSVAGGFLSRVAWDVVNKKVKEVNFLCQDRLSSLRAFLTWWSLSVVF